MIFLIEDLIVFNKSGNTRYTEYGSESPIVCFPIMVLNDVLYDPVQPVVRIHHVGFFDVF